jgi:hypothetical protein
MSRFLGEFTSHYIGEVLTWSEYVPNLDLSHWSWVNCSPDEDRQVIPVGDNLLAYPVYAKDILNDISVSYIELPNNLLAISWDHFSYDVTIVKNENMDEPAGWLLIEEISDHEFGIAYGCNNPFESVEEIKDFLKENEEDVKV